MCNKWYLTSNVSLKSVSKQNGTDL